jgi:hypothetical protein
LERPIRKSSPPASGEGRIRATPPAAKLAVGIRRQIGEDGDQPAQWMANIGRARFHTATRNGARKALRPTKEVQMSSDALRTTLRPAAERADYREPSPYRAAGIAIALVGLMAAAIALVANLVVADEGIASIDTLAWTFGVQSAALAVIMIGIAVVLTGILLRLWHRVDSIKAALPTLRPQAEPAAGAPQGEIETSYGSAEASATAPEPLPINKMAERAWAPMLVMGPMLVAIGFVLSLIQSGESNPETFINLAGWAQGLQFLGLAMVLSGISFLLGTILSSLRKGGGEVQQSLGVSVQTLKMPASAKAFVALMMAGMMVAIVQFVLYLIAIGQDNPASWFAWLAPVRVFGLGLILAGIVLALYTIGTVLGFQFDRLKSIITSGR